MHSSRFELSRTHGPRPPLEVEEVPVEEVVVEEVVLVVVPVLLVEEPVPPPVPSMGGLVSHAAMTVAPPASTPVASHRIVRFMEFSALAGCASPEVILSDPVAREWTSNPLRSQDMSRKAESRHGHFVDPLRSLLSVRAYCPEVGCPDRGGRRCPAVDGGRIGALQGHAARSRESCRLMRPV